MTRKRSSPMGLEIYLPVLLAFIMLPLFAQAAPFKSYTEIQQYTEGCYYNYNHYNEGDRIMTNEPCLNCTCHNKMLMCYLRVCPFTKPIGHDCIVEKREDQCCPIITCPEVPVDVAHAVSEAGTELTFPEKFGCSIDGKFYLEGAQVPSNPNKPCELCYCIKNRTSCLMQECTLHIDGCTPIYNKGSCCPVRYNCDHENDVLELEDHSTTTDAGTTTTTVRPTTGFIITSTMTPAVSTDCVHKDGVYADGTRISGETGCENCYCMRGDIVCAVQECHMPMLNDNGKLCRPSPAAEGECCPSNYICDDDTATTLPYSVLDEQKNNTTSAPVKDLHSAIPKEDLQLQTHIDEEETATKTPIIEGETEEKFAEADIVSKPYKEEIEEETSTKASAIEGELEENVSKVDFVDKTSATDNQHKQEPPNEEVEKFEATTISSEIKPVEGEEFITIASAKDQPESSTDLFVDDKYNTKVTENTDTKHQEEETVTNVSTTANEVPEIATESTDSDEKYATVTSTNVKSETEESITTVSAVDVVESQSTTGITPTEEEISEEIAKPADEVEPISGEEYVTQNPNETEKSVTDANISSEKEQISTVPPTYSPLDIENASQKFEEEQSGTISSLVFRQPDEFATEAPVKSSEEGQEISGDKSGEQFTSVPTSAELLSIAGKPKEQESSITEESNAATTQAPSKVLAEKEGLSTEKPKSERKPEDAEHELHGVVTILPTTSDELSTEFTDEKETLHSTESSVESDELEVVTRLPLLTNKDQPSVTAAPKIEELEEYSGIDTIITIAPMYIDPESTTEKAEISSEEFKDVITVSDDKQKINIADGAAVNSEEEHTIISSTETKPIFDDELGSGDYTTEVIPEHSSEISTAENVSPDQEEENTTPKIVTSTEKKPIEQDSFTELSEQSAESEEDLKLMDLTTIKPSDFDETFVDEKTKEDVEQLEITTRTSFFSDVSTPAAKSSEESSGEEKELFPKTPSEGELIISSTISSKTPDEDRTEGEIDSTTIATSFEEKLSTVEQILSDKSKNVESEVSSTPSITDKSEKHGEIADESAESDDVTTEITIDDQESSTTENVDIITEIKTDQKVLQESGDHKVKEQIGTTEDSTFSTSQTTAHADSMGEPDAKLEKDQKLESTTVQEPSVDVKGGFEEGVPTTTIKPFVEPSHVKDMSELQIPLVIPGEGNCLVGHKTYENNSFVPASDECELLCKCVSSIVNCERVKCDVQENVEKCILSEIGTNKCCPSYICPTDTLPPMSQNSTESTEEDKYKEVQNITAPHKVPTLEKDEKADTDKSEITTTKPTSDSFSPGVSIPEIEMTIAITEEPMSHVKGEDEFEQQTTKAPIKFIPEDSKDIVIEDSSSTTPSAVIEDIVMPQSITPVKEYEQEIVTVEKTEMQAVPEYLSGQKHPEKEFEEQTAIAHGFVEFTTSSSIHMPSDNKKESEVYLTTPEPTVNKYQTVKPTDKEEYDREKSRNPETQTDKEFSNEEEPQLMLPIEPNKDKELVLEPETQSIHTVTDDQLDNLAQSVDKINAETSKPSDETQEEIEGISTTPSKDIKFSTILPDSGEEHPSTDVYKDMSDHTTTIDPTKNQLIETFEEDIIHSTVIPSIDDFEGHISSTTKEPSEKIKDHDILSEAVDENLASTSTIASVIEEVYDGTSDSSKKDYKETIKPTQEGLSEQELEFSTNVSEAGDEILDRTVSPIIYDKHKKNTEEPIAQSSTTEMPISEYSEHIQPETQTNLAFIDNHTIVPISEEYSDKEIEKTTVQASDERTSVYTTPISADTDTDAYKLSSTTSIYEVEDLLTTAVPNFEKSDENTESSNDNTIQSSRNDSVEQQTESAAKIQSEEIAETTGSLIEKATESTKEKNITIPSSEQVRDKVEPSMVQTVDPLVETQDFVTKSTVSLDNEPHEHTAQSTIGPINSDKSISEFDSYGDEKGNKTVSVSEEDKLHEAITVAPGMEMEIQNTYVPVKKPAFNIFEEDSGESLESEEEISTEPILFQNISEIVTQHMEESTSKSTIMSITEETEEASGEGSEEVKKIEFSTEKSHAPTVKQQDEMFVTTEDGEIFNAHEVVTDKISEKEIPPFITKIPIADNESATNAPSEDVSDQKTEKGIIPNATQYPLDEQNAENSTELQLEEEILPSVEDSKRVSAQQPEIETAVISKEITTENPKETEVLAISQYSTESEDVSSEEPEVENMINITNVTMITTQQHEREDSTVLKASTPIEDVTDKFLEGKNVSDVTTGPASAEEIETDTLLHSIEENVQDISKPDEIENITKLDEEIDVEYSTIETTKYPIDIKDIDKEIIFDVTSYPIAFAGNESTTAEITGEAESSQPNITEFTTAKLPADDTSKITASHIPSDDVEPEIYKQILGDVSEKDIDVTSNTNMLAEDINAATTKPSKESEQNLDVTIVPDAMETEATSDKLPVFSDEITAMVVDKTTDQATQKSTTLQNNLPERATELSVIDSDSEKPHEYVTEMPVLPDIMEKATELPAKSTEFEKDESDIERDAVLTTDKFSEEVTEIPSEETKSEEEFNNKATVLSLDTPALTEHLPELAEHETELPPKDVDSEEKIIHEKTTKLPITEHDTELPAFESEKEVEKATTELPVIAKISTVKLPEQDMELSTKETHTEDTKSNEQTTEMPVDVHYSTDNLPVYVPKLPIKDFESEVGPHEQSNELSLGAQTANDQLPAHVTEISTQSHEVDTEIITVTEEMEFYDHVTQLPKDVHKSSEKLPDYITEFPSKNVEPEVEAQESTEKLPEHITESPSEEDLYEEITEKLSELVTKNAESERVSHEISTEFPIMAHKVSTSGQTIEQTTESVSKKEESSKETSTQAAEDIGEVKLHHTTTVHPLFPHYTTLPSVAIDSRIDEANAHGTPVPTKDDETFATSTTIAVSTTTAETVSTSAPHYQPQSPIYGQPPQYGPTQYEDEYTDEDEGEVFGPGTCRYGGKLYVSAQQIPRDDPCDFCFCFRSDIICLQQSCPPPISGCHEEPISGFCCPRYECPVSMATVLNITTSTTTTSTTLPPHFLHHSYGNNVQRNGCLINGRSYRVGEKIESTSGPCINCTCGGDGKMKCDPQACVPEPTMQQVMAVVAAGRKR